MNSNQSRTKDRHVIYPNKEYQKKWRDNRNEKNGIYAVRRKGTDGFSPNCTLGMSIPIRYSI